MLDFAFPRLRRILLLGAHSDDIEIGCGALVLRLVSRYPRAEFRWVIFSAAGERADEARRSAGRFLGGAARKTIEVHQFRDGFFPYDGAGIKETFERDLKGYGPDLILTHQGDDLHQDHRCLAQLTWNTFRDHLILEYEILKYDGGLGSPNVFLPVTEEERRRKVELLCELFPTQRTKDWFTSSSFDALMRIRGVECRAPSGYAEAFYCRKCRLA